MSRHEFKGVITMFFKSTTPYREIQNWITVQLPAVYQSSKNGIDIEIKPHRNKRSNQQNRFLMAIMVALVRFCNETGYIPAGLCHWVIQPTVLKEYWKGRYGLTTTKNIDTAAFGKFIDFIQRTLVEETAGEWEVLQPDSAYIQSLMVEGGF